MKETPIKLMIIDDEEQMRRVLSYIIQSSDIGVFDIKEAASAEEAQKFFEREEFDIVICDYLLENKSGIEFFSDLSLRFPYTVKILISGNVNYDELRGAMKKGYIFRYLSKPFNEEEIMFVLKEAIERIKENRKKREFLSRLKDF